MCQSQQQFQRKTAETGDRPGPMPAFGGTNAPAIAHEIKRVQAAFETELDILANVSYDILDVKVVVGGANVCCDIQTLI